MIAIVVLLLLGAAAGYGSWWFAAGRYSRVPTVAGDTLTSAEAALRSAHYTPGTVTNEFSETVPRGAVIGTDPGSGSRVVRGRTVALDVSKGKERYTVPTVDGDSQSQARTALAAIPVQVATSVISRTSDTVKAGVVLGTDPAGGTQVKRNQVVSLIVSSGLPTVTIPTIPPNTTFSAAEATLKGLDFAVTEVTQFDADVPAGIVIGSQPTGSALKFSTITVYVSKGPQTVVIPNFGTLPALSKVEAELEALGLQVTVQKEFGGVAGRVVQVSPGAGSRVDVGSVVTVTSV